MYVRIFHMYTYIRVRVCIMSRRWAAPWVETMGTPVCVCMYVYVCMQVCLRIYFHIYVHVNVFIYMYVWIFIHAWTHGAEMKGSPAWACMYIYIHMFSYTCVYICIICVTSSFSWTLGGHDQHTFVSASYICIRT